MKRKEDVAVWYAEQIMNHWQYPYDEIEWLVQNLKEDAFQSCAESYDAYMNEKMVG
jgi:hypothetical protein